MMAKRGLIIKKKFDSSHFLKGHQGACANMHGHTYHVDLHLNFGSRPLDSLNMLFDFKLVDGIIEKVIKKYDHQLINSIEPYGKPSSSSSKESIQDFFETNANPTAEYMAEVMFAEINSELRSELGLTINPLVKVVIWETDKYAAVYELENK